MVETLRTVQSFVAPVVVISANGLLCLALYNRLAAVVGRLRAINKERFELLARMPPRAGDEPPATALALRRAEMLHTLGHKLFDRVRLVRDSLVCLLVTVLCMLASSLALGLEPLAPWLGTLALVLFVAGIAVMMLGILRALQELAVALDPVLFEHDMLDETDFESRHNGSQGP